MFSRICVAWRSKAIRQARLARLVSVYFAQGKKSIYLPPVEQIHTRLRQPNVFLGRCGGLLKCDFLPLTP